MSYNEFENLIRKMVCQLLATFHAKRREFLKFRGDLRYHVGRNAQEFNNGEHR